MLCSWHDTDQLTTTGRKAFVRALGPFVADKAHPQRVKLARRLAKLDPKEAPTATSALREALAGPTTEAERVEAAIGLAELSPDDKPLAVKTLREAMTSGKDARSRVLTLPGPLSSWNRRSQPPRPRSVRRWRPRQWDAGAVRRVGLAQVEGDRLAEWSRLVAAGMERTDDSIDRGNLATALGVMRPASKVAVPVCCG